MKNPVMTNKVLQCNLGRSRDAQDLLIRQTQKLGIEVCVISEPSRIPESAGWFCSEDGLAAIYSRDINISRRCRLVKRARKFVIVEWGDILLVSAYISPNSDRSEFLSFLDDLGAEVHTLVNRILICGDFNSKSTHWGNGRTDTRGSLVEEWAAECDLRLLNVGGKPTCVRPQGWSIVDLSWATPDLCHSIIGWRVRDDLESPSDHQYIVIEINTGNQSSGNQGRKRHPRWAWSRCDHDVYNAAVAWEFMQLPATENTPAETLARKIRKALQAACDAAMPRVRFGSRYRPVYWWNEDIAQARTILYARGVNGRKQEPVDMVRMK